MNEDIKLHDKKKCCIVIPFHGDHLTQSQIVSVKSIKRKLQGYDIFFVGPAKVKEAFVDFEDKRTRYKFFCGKYFTSIKSYNRLLLSAIFYKKFTNYEYILIAQTDCLIFSDNLNYWCDKGYSYIGAPWFKGFSDPSKPLIFHGVGNGGLSLRKVDDFLTVFSLKSYLKKTNKTIGFIIISTALWLSKLKYINIGEDRFWGLLVGRYSDFFIVPDPIDAANFSIEVEPKYLCNLIGHLPFGCHAWERYDKDYWVKRSNIIIKN
jgi:hypothetical protein